MFSVLKWNVKIDKFFFEILRACLVSEFKLIFLYFKQYYIHFYIFFYPHVFQKITNNNFQTILPNIVLKIIIFSI